MSGTPQLGPAPQRITVTADQVRRLVAEQFPQWSDLPVRPVARGGWDNWTFHLGPAMSVRLPSAREYVLAVDKEHRWLPQLAPQLPLPISTPLGRGAPGAGYPFPWSVYRWLDGDPARAESIADGTRFAQDLADFLRALQSIDTVGGPPPGTHNWFRGGTLRTFDQTARNALGALRDQVDTDRARRIWDAAVTARWHGTATWFHGDMVEGNLLLRDGELTGVIDFGTCGVGDPSCDLAVAWTLLSAEGRQTFRERLHVDDGAWARGRGWALWKTLATCAEALSDDADAAAALRVLDGILAEE